MNTLQLIKKQIDKASALHDAQIAMTSYRGVKFECKHGIADEVHGTFCHIVVTLITSEAIMQALQVVSLGSIFSIAFLGLLYGELTLLYKR